MRNLRQICASVVLCLVLGVTASAGEMDTAGKTVSTTSTKGDVRTRDALTEALLHFSHNLLFLL